MPVEQLPVILLELAQERSLESLMDRIMQLATTMPRVALHRLWLIEKGDRCDQCPLRAQCADHSRCLHARATSGHSTGEPKTDYAALRDWLPRLPLNLGLAGRLASTGRPLAIDGTPPPELDVPGEGFVAREAVRMFHGIPIMFKGEVLGVTCMLGRGPLTKGGDVWGRVFADHIAGAVANARAFEEIERLKAQLLLENAYLLEEVAESKAFGKLVGRSAPLRQVARQVGMVAPTEATVLIHGETGTGKELVAYEIHQRSRRSAQPMIRVNCASIPKDLYESEFFGHVKGAFTGAIKDRAGRFELADGGTLFLDEVAEIPLDLQGKLLRALQDRQYERVGDERSRAADVRIIAATNRDLKEEVEAGRFRADLYYRLNVFPIHIAPLRERLDDIPLLAAHFVDLSARELKCARPRLTRAGVSALQAYRWPGNVRELRNVIERALILARGGTLHFDLPSPAVAHRAAVPAPAAAAPADRVLTESEMRDRERENTLAALAKSAWRVYGHEGAAELLGIRPTTLLSRMKKMRLRRP